jgi:hypothetical protein
MPSYWSHLNGIQHLLHAARLGLASSLLELLVRVLRHAHDGLCREHLVAFKEHLVAFREHLVAFREHLVAWPRGTVFSQLHSAVTSTVDHPLGSPSSLVVFREHLVAFSEHLMAFRDHLVAFREYLVAFREHLMALRNI